MVNAVIGGWSIASDFTMHTGFALYPHGADSSLDRQRFASSKLRRWRFAIWERPVHQSQ